VYDRRFCKWNHSHEDRYGDRLLQQGERRGMFGPHRWMATVLIEGLAGGPTARRPPDPRGGNKTVRSSRSRICVSSSPVGGCGLGFALILPRQARSWFTRSAVRATRRRYPRETRWASLAAGTWCHRTARLGQGLDSWRMLS